MNWPNIISWIFQGSLILVIAGGLLHRFFRDYIGKTKNVKAKLIDKHNTTYNRRLKFETVIQTDYILVFDVGGKAKRFLVSLFAFDSIQKGEQGFLQYKGSRYIGFYS